MLLRSLSAADRLARLDLALRSAAPELATQSARPLALEISDDGEIRLYTDRPSSDCRRRGGCSTSSRARGAFLPTCLWPILPSTLAEPTSRARRSSTSARLPAVQLFVDLEALGSLSVDAPPSVAASIVRCAAASLAVSPFAESCRVFTVGLDSATQLGSARVESLQSITDAIETLRATAWAALRLPPTIRSRRSRCVPKPMVARHGSHRCCSRWVPTIRASWLHWSRSPGAGVAALV